MSFTPPEIGVAEPVLGGLNRAQSIAGTPFRAAGNLIPQRALSPFGLQNASLPQIHSRQPQHLTSLLNKYQDPEIAPLVAQLSEPVRNALFNFDAERVSHGAPPLTRRQTMLAAQAAQTNQQATPEPDRNPLSLLSNFKDDLSTTLKALPQLPMGIVREVTEIPKIGEHLSEAADQGMNPLAALASAPGIRMIPGAYLAENVARGGEGLKEALSHPLFTALDVLPIASAAAKGTKVAGLAREADAAARLANQPAKYGSVVGGRPRDLKAVLLNRVDDSGELTRSTLGRAVDNIAMGEAPSLIGAGGRLASSAFGRQSRNMARVRGVLSQRAKALAEGVAVPQSELEAMVKDASAFEKRHADRYPQLADDARGTPEAEQFRAKLSQDFARGNIADYDDALIGDYRNLQDRFARYAVSNDLLGMFRDDIYPTHVARKLNAHETRVRGSSFIRDARNEYISPTGTLDSTALRSMLDEVMEIPVGTQRTRANRAFMQVLDAYGVPDSAIRAAYKLANVSKRNQNWGVYRAQVDEILTSTEIRPRASATDIVATLRRYGRDDGQVRALADAIRYGKRGDATRILNGLAKRKPPRFPDAEWPGFAEDIRSASRRLAYEESYGSKITDKKLAQQQRTLDNYIANNPPARFQQLITDRTTDAITQAGVAAREVQLGRNLSPEAAADVARLVQQRRFQEVFPDVDDAELGPMLRQIQDDIAATWRTLRDEGFEPEFVHKVAPGRMSQLASYDVEPVPRPLSQTKERAIDLSGGANDLQVSLSHQAIELLMEQEYRPRFIETVMDSVGVPEAELRRQYADIAQRRFEAQPTRSFEDHLTEAIKRGYDKFDPDKHGIGWGAARLDKFVQAGIYIPKAISENLHRLSQPPSLVSRTLEPVTKLFRYNVIGLSGSVVINNFLGNAVAVTAEQGFGPWRYWNQARDWMRDPNKIPSEELKGMMVAENPNHLRLDQAEFRKSHGGQKFFEGRAASQAFQESAAAEAVRQGKRGLDAVAQKMMQAQQWGDNVYRAMSYMDEFDKATKAGKSAVEAEARAVEMVRRTLVDYNSFTQIERQAIRSIIPFYSYMGHASRFIARYPIDHPVRMMVMSKIADAERERLGALPGSFLEMITLGAMDADGNQLAIPFSPFDPFGDIADLLSISGWMSATNPLISTALEQAGIVRGEADAYPTLRYDEESGSLKPVQPSLLNTLIGNVAPRGQALMSILEINSEFEDLQERDPSAAARSLASQFGLPRLHRSVNMPEARIRAELARQSSESDVRNDALKSGDWREALRYPNLAAIYRDINAAPGEALTNFSPVEASAITDQLKQLYQGATS